MRGFYSGFFTVFKVSVKRLVYGGESIVKVVFWFLFGGEIDLVKSCERGERDQAKPLMKALATQNFALSYV